MSGKSFLRKWIGEYNAVVVGTVATAEAENICLKNGLLFHELLSSFGHLDGLNATIRTGNQSFMLSDAHIRFERNTEMKPKSGELVEKLMKDTFEEFEMSKLPQNVGELKASTPSAWTSKMEAIAMRLQAFNEWEMTSHPYIILTVVATSDIDHVLCMQELASMHHTPISVQNGQYDPSTVHRLFILLHDAHDTSRNPYMMLQQLQSRFAAANTKLLTINSFPENTPNLQQPDMWSRFLAPRFFPENIPENPNTKIQNLPINPTSGQPVLGSRLSMEDFMTLRNFCIDIYNQFIIPNIEKRLIYLNKQVNDNKKGMKNVLKSFWRKSREDENIKGQVKYRYDKIESQILLLADTSFMIKDYDTAYNMYKLVKDDYKSDKSLLHLAHVYIMMSTCQILLDPIGKIKDIYSDLESLGQLLAINAEFPYINAYYSLLASEIYILNYSTRSPLDAANILLLSVKHMQNSPLLSAMLIEKAAYYFLHAQQSRKYVLYSTICGNKLLQCSNNSNNNNKKYNLQHHAAVCFATSMLILDSTNWGDLKSKLNKTLSEDMKILGINGARRSLLLMLKLLNAAMGENKDVGQTDSLKEAASVFREIISSGAWGCIQVQAGWKNLTAREIMLQDLPITEVNPSDCINKTSSSNVESYCEVSNLPVPVVDVSSAMLDHCERGIESASTAALPDSSTVVDLAMAEEMYAFLELERQWMEEQQQGSRAQTPIMSPTEEGEDTFADKWAELEAQLTRQREGNKSGAVAEEVMIRIPLGEKVRLKLTMSNKLPIDVHLDNVHLAMQPAESFATQGVSLALTHDLTKEIVLTTQPLHLGKYRIDCAKWNLSNSLCVKQSLVKPGPLLQRTRQQRATAERGPDTTLCFEVVPAHPLLKMEFEGLSPEVLQGQLLKSTLVLRNEGASTACDIYIKLSQPLFVFYLSQVINSDGTTTTTSPTAPAHGLLSTGGGSSTLLRLAEGTSIAPGQALRFEAWMMVSRIGTQQVSLLASYKALNADGTKQPFGPGTRCRTSFVSIKTKVLPSLGIAMRMVPKPSSVEHFTMITEIVNYLRNVDLDHSPDNFGRDRFSSVGQLDLPDLTTGDEHIEIEDNAIKVMGLWLLGAGVPFRYKPSPRALIEAGDSSNTVIRSKQGADLLACPSERITRCFPVKITGQKSSLTSGSSTAVHGQCSWLLPMPAPANAKDKHLHLVQVVEQFLCIASATARFDREVDSSRMLVQAAELEAETMGPRSIAQVRREKLQLQNSPTGLPIGSPIVLSDISKAEGCGITTPSSAQDLADLAATGNSLTVAAVWACRWEGKLRWGMHKISTLSFIGEGVSAVGGQLGGPGTSAGRKASAIGAGIVLPSSQSGRPAADFLLLGVKHVSTLTLPTTPPHAVEVPVTLSLRSLSNEPLSVTIAAIDLTTATSNKFTSTAPQYVYNDQPEYTFEKVANLGLRWNGKTQHIGIVIPPNSEKEVHMCAYLTQPGTFDLNRFKVSVRFNQSVNSQLTVKPFMGQSLITVKKE